MSARIQHAQILQYLVAITSGRNRYRTAGQKPQPDRLDKLVLGGLLTMGHPQMMSETGLATSNDGNADASKSMRKLASNSTSLVCMPRMKFSQAMQLRLLLRHGRAREFVLVRRQPGIRIAKRIDADDWITALVLLVLVIKRLFLDLAA